MKLIKYTSEFPVVFRIFILFSFFPFYCLSQSQKGPEEEIRSIIRNKKATVGVAVIYDGKDTVAINDFHYPMLSVYKFHQALSVLHYLEQNGKSPEEEIFISLSALKPDTYSPLRDKYPEGNFYMSIRELMKYSVSLSDNNACDILFDYIGGPEVTEKYIRSLGIDSVGIATTEEEMHQHHENVYLNYTSPLSAAKLMEMLITEKLLSEINRNFIISLLIETSTGADKIKGLLPEGTIVGHKTGSSFRTAEGVKIADNDLGFIILPSGKKCTLAVFITQSMENDKENAAIIAAIAKTVYDYYK
ncbi:MAG: class A beta-lactamase, subclass A2 [Candidatus Azobacteroides sp.]|nr:class A beta-lactamase, subclass A2 [Candidatus Azobacteroides sp.]